MDDYKISKTIHKKSCLKCKFLWYHVGSSRWFCHGLKKPGIANLRSFPFSTEQSCCAPLCFNIKENNEVKKW